MVPSTLGIDNGQLVLAVAYCSFRNKMIKRKEVFRILKYDLIMLGIPWLPSASNLVLFFKISKYVLVKMEPGSEFVV